MSKIERIKCGNGNAYLVYEGDGAILVDTCREASREILLQSCLQKRVRLIVLTHGHIDHVQNAAYLSQRLDVPIAMHRDDVQLIKDNWAEPLSARSLLGKVILKMSMKSFEEERIEPFEPSVFLEDADTLDEYGVSAAVVGLPGHTKGSIGLLVNNTDLIVGDALMNILYPTKSPLYGNRTIMEESAAKISSLGKTTIYFGHGNPVKNRTW